MSILTLNKKKSTLIKKEYSVPGHPDLLYHFVVVVVFFNLIYMYIIYNIYNKVSNIRFSC